MLRSLVSAIPVFFALQLTGCAFVPQKVELAPKVATSESREGNGTRFGFRVLDERTTKLIGRRGAGPGWGDAAEITTNQDLAIVVHHQLAEAFRRKSFNPIEYNSASTTETKVSVEIRAIDYTTSTGFWTGGVHMNGAIKASAVRGPKVYERLYRIEDEERVLVSPTAESNEALINDALGKLLSQLLADQALIDFLKSTK